MLGGLLGLVERTYELGVRIGVFVIVAACAGAFIYGLLTAR